MTFFSQRLDKTCLLSFISLIVRRDNQSRSNLKSSSSSYSGLVHPISLVPLPCAASGGGGGGGEEWGKKLHIPHSQKPHRAQPAPSQVPYIHMPTWRPADEDRDEDFVKRNSAADIEEY